MNEDGMIKFGIKSIRTDEFATIDNAVVQEDKIQLNHSFSIALNDDANELTVSFKVTFNSENQPFIVIQVSCVFNINSDNILISAKGAPKKIEIPKGFMTHLAFLTTGTARGILHSKLEGTTFNKYLLPILDVSRLFDKDAIFEFSENNHG
jgi:hypothetical protein